ncbi:NUDIX domain-containing protein [Gemelliphila palaticanis]|uniref:NUDIX domain-containing protein n=1 Tax=Gemelliphila palaticanis TaxID=81950 RepID=A0ABX2SYN4_9BACL|nr:NUDIX domain-containing protein [Gemella palaticanis]MBF0715521.1 NUDIX domain-containing protein [Gemella palaticanis]NYS47451.1 NUDIX domain-containing protein [Gemella palaticanis]
MSKWDEQILVVNRKEIFSDEKNAFYGFISLEDSRVEEIVKTFEKYEVKRRGDMEEDPSYKQLIGYVLVKDKNTKEVLVYKRLVGGGESRLHGKASVGIGGHMNDVENTPIEEIVKINAAREIEEEIGISFDEALNSLNFVGLINDDKEEVGKVHIGLIYVCEVDKNKVKVTEDDTLKIEWLNSNEAKKVENYESWSEFLIPIM